MLKRIGSRLRAAGLRLCLFNLVVALVVVNVYPQQAAPITRPQPLDKDKPDCRNVQNLDQQFDVIIVGAGLAGLSAAKELQHLDRKKILILEANNRIGGRAYVGHIGPDEVPIDYGGAWIHGVPTNPLTSLVDSMGFTRVRTELTLPYFVNGQQASEQEKKVFDQAVEKYENAVELAAQSVEDQHALAEFACREYKKTVTERKKICGVLERSIPFSQVSHLDGLCHGPLVSRKEFCTKADKDLRITSDVARDYVPDDGKFTAILPLLIANAGPLESAAELKKTSAVDGARFEAGEDDLVAQGMGTFVEKLGDGLPVCLKAPVTEIDYSGNQVKVSAGGRVFQGYHALVTVSVGVLKKKRSPSNRNCRKRNSKPLIVCRWATCRRSSSPSIKISFPMSQRTHGSSTKGTFPGRRWSSRKSRNFPVSM